MAVLLLAAAALDVEAQNLVQRERGPQTPAGFHFQFTSPLEMRAGREQNLPVGQGVVHDRVLRLLSPTSALVARTPRTDFSLSYQPEFEIFERRRDLNAWHHTATFRLVHRATPRWKLELGDDFLRTQDASPRLRGSVLLLPRGGYQQNQAYVDAGYAWSPQTKLNFRFDNAVTTLDLPGIPQENSFDQAAYVWSAALSHDFNRQQSLTANYSFLRRQPLGADAPGSIPEAGSSAQQVSLVYSHELKPSLRVVLSGGAIAAGQLSYRFSGHIERTGRALTLLAGYQRYFSFLGGLSSLGVPATDLHFSSGLAPTTFFEAATLRLQARLGRRLTTTLAGTGGRNVPARAEDKFKSISGAGRLDVQLVERISVFFEAEFYGQNRNKFLGQSVARRRYFAGLAFHLAPPASFPQVLPAGAGSGTSGDSRRSRELRKGRG